METSQIIQAWGKILKGEAPTLSIEITRECPLRCPGCYAYEDAHLGGGKTLRELNDRKGQALVDGVLEVVDRFKPLHLSIVGGDPLVRYRELETLIPLLMARGVHVQLVTSAFRPMHESWVTLDHLHIAVSIDGLQPEHDVRRAPATYERILKNIVGQRVTVHCTITGQMMKRPGYLEEFLKFWTPQAGDQESLVQHVHAAGGRYDAGNPDPAGAVAGHRRNAGAAEKISEAGYAGAGDSRICSSAEEPAGLYFCDDHGNHVGGSGDDDHAVPVWRDAGLRVVRLHGVDGLGGGGRI